MILSDHTIHEAIEAGRISIEPFDPSCVQPCSYDVTLGPDFLVQHPTSRIHEPIDPRLADSAEMHSVTVTDEFIVEPGTFCLGATCERIALPSDIAGRIEGKSSLARLGLVIHQTAGFLDAGFIGQITLELVNVARRSIVLYPGMKIGQISFIQMTTAADRPYGSSGLNSKYQHQDGPTASAYHDNGIYDRARPDPAPHSEPEPVAQSAVQPALQSAQSSEPEMPVFDLDTISERFSTAMKWRPRTDGDT